MTPEDKYGAKLFGSAIAIIVLMIIAAVFVVPWVASLIDDGHRAYPPSAYERRR